MWRLIISLAFILAVKSQQSPVYYYQSLVYAMPWQPLTVAPSSGAIAAAQQLDTRQLSLGYTGPQIFPEAPASQAQQQRRRPIVLAMLTPHAVQGQFTLPFRPSPFAGYSLDEQEQQQQQQQQQQQHQQQQQQQLEPGFYAPGYPQQTLSSSNTEEPSDEQDTGEDQQQQHFIYMSRGTLYNLVSS